MDVQEGALKVGTIEANCLWLLIDASMEFLMIGSGEAFRSRIS